MIPVSLEHLLTRTARAFGVTPAQMRSKHNAVASADARKAFCRLAVLAGAGLLAVGMKIARDARWVDAAVWEAGNRFDADRDFAQRYQEVELECVAEVGVSQATLYPLPEDTDPRTTAERLIHSPRAAMAVGVADLAGLGAAFCALDDEITLLRAELAALKKPLFKLDFDNGEITQIESACG